MKKIIKEKDIKKDKQERQTKKTLLIINDLDKCIYGEYTGKDFKGCKTCKSPKIVICSNPKTVGKQRNNKLCNPVDCKHFKNI